MYLGGELFEATYGESPLVLSEPGLIEREELLIDRSVLDELAGRMPLGIATGRPKAEASHALKQYSLEGLFASVVDDDDVRQAESHAESLRGEAIRLGKPHPWSLLETVRRMGMEVNLAAYVGDTPDDVRAARAANATIPFIAIGTGRGDDEFKWALAAFREVAADIILGHPNNLRLLDIWAPRSDDGS
jgi:phosphoglycolate phosphatase-like HAD superfamily hydrolase